VVNPTFYYLPKKKRNAYDIGKGEGKLCSHAKKKGGKVDYLFFGKNKKKRGEKGFPRQRTLWGEGKKGKGGEEERVEKRKEKPPSEKKQRIREHLKKKGRYWSEKKEEKRKEGSTSLHLLIHWGEREE